MKAVHRTRVKSRRVTVAIVCTVLLSGIASAETPATSDSGDDGFKADIRTTVADLVHQQKKDFLTFPSDLAHGEHWAPLVLVSAATAGLILADRYDTSYFRKTSAFSGYNSAMSGTATMAGIIAVPAALYTFGRFEHDSSMKRSGILAGEALIDGEVAGELIKFAAQRRRPQDINPNGNFADSFGDAKSVSDAGFPSGHTIGAFAVASVISERYGHRHRWMPLVAYGAAAAVGFSRVTTSAHFVSDAFFGAAMGYAIGHFTVGAGIQ